MAGVASLSKRGADSPSRPFGDAIILAAGTSARMGGPDKLRMVVGGLPLLAWTVASAAQATTVRRIIVVSRADRVSAMNDEPWIRAVGATVVVGGERRQDSVAAGVEASDGEVVLIHDGARPLVRPELFDQVALAAREHGTAVPVVPVAESMRRIVDGRIVGILDKADLYRSQTPHGAQREVILRAYERQDPRGVDTFIDETALVQSTGLLVSTVPGDPANLKVTLPGDEQLVFALLEARAQGSAPRESQAPEPVKSGPRPGAGSSP